MSKSLPEVKQLLCPLHNWEEFCMLERCHPWHNGANRFARFCQEHSLWHHASKSTPSPTKKNELNWNSPRLSTHAHIKNGALWLCWKISIQYRCRGRFLVKVHRNLKRYLHHNVIYQQPHEAATKILYFCRSDSRLFCITFQQPISFWQMETRQQNGAECRDCMDVWSWSPLKKTKSS